MLIKLTKLNGDVIYLESYHIVEIEQMQKRKRIFSRIRSRHDFENADFSFGFAIVRGVDVAETPDEIVEKIELNRIKNLRRDKQ